MVLTSFETARSNSCTNKHIVIILARSTRTLLARDQTYCKTNKLQVFQRLFEHHWHVYMELRWPLGQTLLNSLHEYAH